MSVDLERPVVLAILDGWGHAPDGPGNAIARAPAPRLAALARDNPSCLVEAAGRAVGLPEGVMGNSEVGHLTLGAGRIVDQDLVRISEACRAGEVADAPALRELLAAVIATGGRLHHLGLCSDAGVHSHLDHLEALVRAAAEAGVRRQFVHCFTDGRDTPPDSAASFVRRVESFLAAVPGTSMATVSGRYWAMDRDRRWDRTQRAHAALVGGEGHRAASAEEAVARSHERGQTDEFVEPTVVDPEGVVRDGDGILFFNFRADRGRQLTRAFTDPSFSEFERPHLALAGYVTMTEYDASFGLPVLFPPREPDRTVGEVFARAGWPQLRLAETEKYAHVTYFFNGGREEAFPGEERALVPSARVATYDLVPAMAAREITARATDWVGRGGRRLLVVNYANADMVGHTGVLAATLEACRVVDECVGELASAVDAARGLLVVTSDHGNAERLLDERGRPVTAHTCSPVPVIVRDARPGSPPLELREGGGLSDVAPTLLRAAGLTVPDVMTASGLERGPS